MYLMRNHDTGSHLHLEVSVDGNRADVLRYFKL